MKQDSLRKVFSLIFSHRDKKEIMKGVKFCFSHLLKKSKYIGEKSYYGEIYVLFVYLLFVRIIVFKIDSVDFL